MTQTGTQNQQQERRWIYNQRTGQLRDPDGRIVQERGYSGTPTHRNNPASENVVGQGPIPGGQWRIDNNVPQNRPSTGAYSIGIQPEGHNAHGRAGFYIHGDSRQNPGTASRGCPIFSRRQREAIYNSGVRRFDVVNEPEWQ